MHLFSYREEIMSWIIDMDAEDTIPDNNISIDGMIIYVAGNRHMSREWNINALTQFIDNCDTWQLSLVENYIETIAKQTNFDKDELFHKLTELLIK